VIEDDRSGVKRKASTKFIARIAKHTDRWDLVKRAKTNIDLRPGDDIGH
jgi:hypothetical protein